MSEELTEEDASPLAWPKGSRSKKYAGMERRGAAEKSLDRHERKVVPSKQKAVWEAGSWINGVSILKLEEGREGVKGYDKAHNQEEEGEGGKERGSGRGTVSVRRVWERVHYMWRAFRYGGCCGR